VRLLGEVIRPRSLVGKLPVTNQRQKNPGPKICHIVQPSDLFYQQDYHDFFKIFRLPLNGKFFIKMPTLPDRNICRLHPENHVAHVPGKKPEL